MNGIELIAAERQRQQEVEGWTPEHDDKHNFMEMFRAAVCYADPIWQTIEYEKKDVPLNWPWEDFWYKPSADQVRNLVKAGALIVAEIDRIQRASLQKEAS